MMNAKPLPIEVVLRDLEFWGERSPQPYKLWADSIRADMRKRDAEIERLRDLLKEARDGLQYETENNHPDRRWFAPDMRGYEQDMDIVQRIDAALAGREGKS